MKTVTALQMKDWLGGNDRSQVYPTDQWYLQFANKLYPVVKQSPLFVEAMEYRDAAISLSMYLHDVISQNGGWKEFSDFYYQKYGTYMPFYEITEDYVPDEINQQDIAFVLWTLKSHCAIFADDAYTLQDPYDENLLALSHQVYEMMDEVFEDAPISEEPTLPFWVMGLDLLEMESLPLPEITPDTELEEDVRLALEYSGGKPLLYFVTYKELCNFFVDVLGWDNTASSLLPDLKYYKEFVVYANAKGLLIGPGVAAYFCEEQNPMYNAKRAAEQGYEMFCRPGVCPFDLLKYGMGKGIMPDIQFPFPNGKEIFRKYWDFFARYYLCEYYEGI